MNTRPGGVAGIRAHCATSCSLLANSRPDVVGGSGLPSARYNATASSTIWHSSSKTAFSFVPWQPPKISPGAPPGHNLASLQQLVLGEQGDGGSLVQGLPVGWLAARRLSPCTPATSPSLRRSLDWEPPRSVAFEGELLDHRNLRGACGAERCRVSKAILDILVAARRQQSRPGRLRLRQYRVACGQTRLVRSKS